VLLNRFIGTVLLEIYFQFNPLRDCQLAKYQKKIGGEITLPKLQLGKMQNVT
jgi:hypothetical protein